jgi:cell division septal protein FtsQ
MLASIAAVLCYEAYELLARTTFLQLERIDVTNIRRLKRQDVVALTGIRPGDPMLRLDLRHIAEQVKKSPWIEKVQVRRNFPHTLTLEITEWVPAAVANMGYIYYVDKKGEVFKPLTQGDDPDFPVLTGLGEEDLAKDPAGSKAMLKTAIELTDLLRAGAVFKLEDISEIHIDKGYGYTLFTAKGGVPVKLGNDGFVGKLARLSRIYKDLSAQLLTLEYIDLNYNDKIVVKKV